MKSIDQLTKADFEALVGQTLSVGGAELDITRVKDGLTDAGYDRKPFTVLLTAREVQGAPVFDDVVSVSHEALGELDLLVHRIVGRHDQANYQIVFN